MNDASDDECNQDTKHKGVLRHRPDFVPDIFPANKPPEKKQRVLVRGRKHADASSYSVQSNGGRGSSSASAASAHTAEVDEVTSSARAKSKRVERSSYEKPAELLDSRDVPDADELYTENERALSQFIRLHPMLRSHDLHTDRVPHFASVSSVSLVGLHRDIVRCAFNIYPVVLPCVPRIPLFAASNLHPKGHSRPQHRWWTLTHFRHAS